MNMDDCRAILEGRYKARYPSDKKDPNKPSSKPYVIGFTSVKGVEFALDVRAKDAKIWVEDRAQLPAPRWRLERLPASKGRTSTLSSVAPRAATGRPALVYWPAHERELEEFLRWIESDLLSTSAGQSGSSAQEPDQPTAEPLTQPYRTQQQVQDDFDRALQFSLHDDPSKRRARLEKADPRPRKLTVTTTVFVRNADVVAEVLSRAQGHCEECGASAPFLRAKDGSPYLEVHHRVPLASGNGIDTVDNAVALCPNCHRRMHFGTVAAN